MKKVIQDAEKATVKIAAEVKEEAPKMVKKAAKAAEKTKEAAEKTKEVAEKTVKSASKTAKTTVKEAAKKAEAASSEAKKAVTATASKISKKEIKETVYLQYYGKEIDKDDVMKKVKEVWTKEMKKKIGDMRTVALYLKPEDNQAYFVINGEVTGSVSLD